MDDKTTRELLADIAQLLKPVSELSQEIVTRADLQAYTENLYNQLVVVAQSGMLAVIRKSILLPEQKDVQHPKLSHYHASKATETN